MPSPDKQHESLLDIEHRDGHLIWGKLDITAIVEKAGSTPFYAYSRRRMTQKIDDLRGHLSTDLSIHYAMKANPMPAVVNHMASIVDGLDVASGGELRRSRYSHRAAHHG